ncbi:hypothetical protein MPSEU_000669400 [Mayamaea pseudoterrestris]|nr:hypothetical protein MPSEU_000669400 [Mayamaea pseudoterrestris]
MLDETLQSSSNTQSAIDMLDQWALHVRFPANVLIGDAAIPVDTLAKAHVWEEFYAHCMDLILAAAQQESTNRAAQAAALAQSDDEAQEDAQDDAKHGFRDDFKVTSLSDGDKMDSDSSAATDRVAPSSQPVAATLASNQGQSQATAPLQGAAPIMQIQTQPAPAAPPVASQVQSQPLPLLEQPQQVAPLQGAAPIMQLQAQAAPAPFPVAGQRQQAALQPDTPPQPGVMECPCRCLIL